MNKQYTRKSYLLFAVVLLLFRSTIALAGLGVDPVTLEIVAHKGCENIGEFKLINTGESPIKIGVELNKGADKEGNPWFNVDPMALELGPGEQKNVTYRITLSEDSSGELKSMVFFVADELGENKSPIGIRFGVPIYVAVSGTEVMDVNIKKINVKHDINNNTLSGTILVDNKSNVHIRPHIKILIYDSKDNLITSFSPMYGQPAQKEQLRAFLFQQGLNIVPGKYKLVAKVDYGRLYGLDDKVAEKKAAFIVRGRKEPLSGE